MGVAGGTIERSCYSPHYVNTERDYERDYQATLPQGRTAADGRKPRHGRDDRKRERSVSGLRRVPGSPMGGTTGVSHEQGLGLTDVPRRCPGRRPGDERSYAPGYYFMLMMRRTHSFMAVLARLARVRH